MDQDAKRALEGSISKWQNIVDKKGGDGGTDNCPLCEIFYYPEDEELDDCEYCPVSIAVKARCCVDTPYDEWLEHWMGCHRSSYEDDHKWVECDTCLELAKKELEFLKSLRPTNGE